MVKKLICFVALVLLLVTQWAFAKNDLNNEKRLELETPEGSCIYSFEKSKDSLEFVSNNSSNGEKDRVTCQGESVIELKLVPGNRAIALVKLNSGGRQLVTFDLKPLRILSVLNVARTTSRIFPIDKSHAVVIDFGAEKPNANQNVFRFVVGGNNPGQIQYIDVEQGKVSQEHRFNSEWTYQIDWNEENNVLTMQGVITFHDYNGSRGIFEYNGKSVLGRISDRGMKCFDLASLVWDSQYDSQKDLFYGLTSGKLEVINCSTGEKKASSIGQTSYDLIISVPEKELHYTTPYKVNVYSDQNRLIVYNVWNGEVKVIDAATLKVSKKLKAGRMRANIQEYVEDNRTIVAPFKDLSRTYTLEQGASKIRIFDETFKEVGTLLIPEKPLAMYALGTPFIVTENGLYKIENDSLVLVRKLEHSTKKVIGFNFGKMFFLKTDYEVILANSETGQIVSNL